MSLNWNLSRIANKDTVCYRDHGDGEQRLTSLTHNLIWSTMAVDMGEITAKTVDEWHFRLQCIALVYGDQGWSDITREDIANHIGLSTNVIKRTRKQFLAKMATVLERKATAAVRQAAAVKG